MLSMELVEESVKRLKMIDPNFNKEDHLFCFESKQEIEFFNGRNNRIIPTITNRIITPDKKWMFIVEKGNNLFDGSKKENYYCFGIDHIIQFNWLLKPMTKMQRVRVSVMNRYK